jgi:(p)ppGpp synthase/HD superfamily hydrolase
MIYSETMQRAVHLAVATHEVNQKRTRKGKDIAYITHPLTVGLILARANADEDTVVAGILHDTIEDSAPAFRVTGAMIESLFGSAVASLVESVTERPKTNDWQARKMDALLRVASYSRESVLIKSADILANDWELINDVRAEGDGVFDRFNGPKQERLDHQHRMIEALLKRWPASPLAGDLRALAAALSEIDADQPLVAPSPPNQIGV